MSMLDTIINNKTLFFQYLIDEKLVDSDHICYTQDGFYLINRSISSILLSKGTYPRFASSIL